MCYIFNEFCLFIRGDLGDRSDFNPLGEFVYNDKDMFIATRGGFKRPYRVETVTP
jgi:hypothetical protein